MTGRRSRWLVPSIAAITVALAGCGSLAASAGAGGAAVDRAAVEAQANAMYLQMWGNAEQKDAGHYLQMRDIYGPVATCMTRQGFDFHPEISRVWVNYHPVGLYGSWLSPLDEPLASEEALGGVAGAPATMDFDSGQPGWDNAFAECGGKDAPVPDGVGTPASVEPVTAAWTQMLSDVDNKLGSPKPYAECMAAGGFKLNDETLGVSSTIVQLQSMSGAASPPAPGQEARSAWTGFLAEEQRVLALDHQCRADKYLEGLALLQPRLQEFQATYADQLKSIQGDWQNMLEEAEAAGYKP